MPWGISVGSLDLAISHLFNEYCIKLKTSHLHPKRLTSGQGSQWSSGGWGNWLRLQTSAQMLSGYSIANVSASRSLGPTAGIHVLIRIQRKQCCSSEPKIVQIVNAKELSGSQKGTHFKVKKQSLVYYVKCKSPPLQVCHAFLWIIKGFVYKMNLFAKIYLHTQISQAFISLWGLVEL